jgi:hypothetical protein
MKLEQQVCSLDLSKHLKELGVKQESLFVWGLDVVEGWRISLREIQEPDDKGEFNYAAFTVAELGEMLPSIIEDNGAADFKQLRIWKHYVLKTDGEWGITYRKTSGDFKTKDNIFDDKEANTRAKMLVYLIEQGIVKP